MKKIRFTAIFLVLCIAVSALVSPAFAIEDPTVGANAVLVADADTGRFLFTKNINDRVAPASLTKIMTILLAVEQLESGNRTEDHPVTAPPDCRIGMDEMSSTSGIVPGEVVSYIDLIYCAMLDSANEACNCLAVDIAGSISAFVEMMNNRAAQLGMTGTHFVNTNGLTESEHYTTAYDFYLLTVEALKHETFVTVCNTAVHVVPATNVAAERTINNSNALISSGSIYGSNYLYQYASGVKTGYTSAAGYCLISTASKDTTNVIAVVMGCTGPNNSSRTDHGNFVDTIALYNWVFDNFSRRKVLSTADVLDKVPVDMAENDAYAALRPVTDVSLLLPNDVTADDVSFRVKLYDSELTAPVEAGTVLGEAAISVKGEDYCIVRLANYSDIALARGEFIRRQLNEMLGKAWVKVVIVIVAAVVLLYLILVMRYRSLRRKHLKKKKLAEQRRRAERERIMRQAAGAPPEPTQRFTAVRPDDREFR